MFREYSNIRYQSLSIVVFYLTLVISTPSFTQNVAYYSENNLIFYPTDGTFITIQKWKANKFESLEELRACGLIEDIYISAHVEYSDSVLNGSITYFLNDSVLIIEGNMCSGIPCGIFSTYTPECTNGRITSRLHSLINFSRLTGLKEGNSQYYASSIHWYTNFNHKEVSDYLRPWITTYYSDGLKNGAEIYYNQYGQITLYELYKNGTLEDGKYLTRWGVIKNKNGECQYVWKYDSQGKIVTTEFKVPFIRKYLSFNKLKFPLKKLVKGKITYEDYLKSRL